MQPRCGVAYVDHASVFCWLQCIEISFIKSERWDVAFKTLLKQEHSESAASAKVYPDYFQNLVEISLSKDTSDKTFNKDPIKFSRDTIQILEKCDHLQCSRTFKEIPRSGSRYRWCVMISYLSKDTWEQFKRSLKGWLCECAYGRRCVL